MAETTRSAVFRGAQRVTPSSLANQAWERPPLRGTSLTELCQSESHIPGTTIRWCVHLSSDVLKGFLQLTVFVTVYKMLSCCGYLYNTTTNIISFQSHLTPPKQSTYSHCVSSVPSSNLLNVSFLCTRAPSSPAPCGVGGGEGGGVDGWSQSAEAYAR